MFFPAIFVADYLPAQKYNFNLENNFCRLQYEIQNITLYAKKV